MQANPKQTTTTVSQQLNRPSAWRRVSPTHPLTTPCPSDHIPTQPFAGSPAAGGGISKVAAQVPPSALATTGPFSGLGNFFDMVGYPFFPNSGGAVSSNPSLQYSLAEEENGDLSIKVDCPGCPAENLLVEVYPPQHPYPARLFIRATRAGHQEVSAGASSNWVGTHFAAGALSSVFFFFFHFHPSLPFLPLRRPPPPRLFPPAPGAAAAQGPFPCPSGVMRRSLPKLHLSMVC